MTPAQQAALVALAGRDLTQQEYVDIDALLPVRNDVAIAAILSEGQASVMRSIRVEDVFDIVFDTGDYIGLKTAQLQGHPLAVMVFSVLEDAKKLGPGMVNLQAAATVELFTQLQDAGLLSAASRTAFAGRASEKPSAINFNAVSDALNIAEGRMTL